MHNPPNCEGYCLECEYNDQDNDERRGPWRNDPDVHVRLMTSAVHMGLTDYDKANNNNMLISDISVWAESPTQYYFIVTTVSGRRFRTVVQELGENEPS